MEKAYKLLAIQEGVSNSKAKEWIDKGIVYIENKKVTLARAELNPLTKFHLLEVEDIKVIFENDNLIAVNKPPFYNSEDLLKKFKGTTLLHRLDRETSGVIILTKNEDFRTKAIGEFIKNNVYKEYVAVVNGRVMEEFVINDPIMTIKGGSAKSVISHKGKPATTRVYPLEIHGKKSKIKVVIDTGRTHQIRVHLSSKDFPVVGDTLYGIKSSAKRVMLHSKKIKLFNYEFEAPEPVVFNKLFG